MYKDQKNLFVLDIEKTKVMRRSRFMSIISETKARILLAKIFIKPLKTASCQSKRTVFGTVKEMLPVGKSLFTLNAINSFHMQRFPSTCLFCLKVKWWVWMERCVILASNSTDLLWHHVRDSFTRNAKEAAE